MFERWGSVNTVIHFFANFCGAVFRLAMLLNVSGELFHAPEIAYLSVIGKSVQLTLELSGGAIQRKGTAIQ